ncbi:hypothetical protein DFH08DRAFT_414348 [Mycena albidolilacea]|uniref:Uncharacterized protein n=1 Tax=Mycena albidolilacea TaxID=1033008 RepID=A0AAD7AIN4_9AGAR|nr:hypothetical protein DFH08DRAFT_414348 [Mycena albidolilacea]
MSSSPSHHIMDLVSTSFTAPATTAVLPNCNACHTAPVSGSGFATCRPCRDKRNEAKRRTTQRKREQKYRLFQTMTISRDNLPVPLLVPTLSAAMSLKRKTPPARADGENVADVLERIGKRFKKLEPFTKADAAASKTSTAAPAPDSEFEKFIVNTDLHKAIKRRYADNSSTLRFHGTYAIIAQPETDNKARARQVARDLRDSTPLHFSLDDKEASRSATAYTIKYKCTCRGGMKRTASDLSSYFISKSKAAASDETTPKSECRGRIEIRSEDDRSHRLGWLGQRIKVTIMHPKNI